MNARQPIGPFVATCPRAIASVALMHAAVDDTSDYAQALAEASPLSLTTPALLAEVDALTLRIARCETRARDVTLVHQLAARLRTASMAPARNRERLEGMLVLDLPKARFANVICSNCGRAFGPGDSGFSHCQSHRHLRALSWNEERAIEQGAAT